MKHHIIVEREYQGQGFTQFVLPADDNEFPTLEAAVLFCCKMFALVMTPGYRFRIRLQSTGETLVTVTHGFSTSWFPAEYTAKGNELRGVQDGITLCG